MAQRFAETAQAEMSVPVVAEVDDGQRRMQLFGGGRIVHSGNGDRIRDTQSKHALQYLNCFNGNAAYRAAEHIKRAGKSVQFIQILIPVAVPVSGFGENAAFPAFFRQKLHTPA